MIFIHSKDTKLSLLHVKDCNHLTFLLKILDNEKSKSFLC